MFSSSNNGIGSFSPYFPLSTSFFGHETVLITQNPNILQNDFPSFVETIPKGFVKHYTPSYESDLPREIPKKKKDMHRKINTAKGPRERRVRLSLTVAQKFFDLQDMLGFDKASKTLDWLLGKSNTAIDELKKISNRHVNSICDCEKSAFCSCEWEVLSDQTNEDSKISIYTNSNLTREKRSSFQSVGRELRSKARERARKRTKEKMGATRACDIMHLGTRCPIMNRNEAHNYSDKMEMNCSINEQEAQRTCPIEDSFSINRSSMKPFSILSTASSSIDCQNWANIGTLAPHSQPFSYYQSSLLETEFQDL